MSDSGSSATASQQSPATSPQRPPGRQLRLSTASTSKRKLAINLQRGGGCHLNPSRWFSRKKPKLLEEYDTDHSEKLSASTVRETRDNGGKCVSSYVFTGGGSGCQEIRKNPRNMLIRGVAIAGARQVSKGPSRTEI